jgi:hypothetical protein
MRASSRPFHATDQGFPEASEISSCTSVLAALPSISRAVRAKALLRLSDNIFGNSRRKISRVSLGGGWAPVKKKSAQTLTGSSSGASNGIGYWIPHHFGRQRIFSLNL